MAAATAAGAAAAAAGVGVRHSESVTREIQRGRREICVASVGDGAARILTIRETLQRRVVSVAEHLQQLEFSGLIVGRDELLLCICCPTLART